MHRAAHSVWIFSLYLAVLGALLLIVPRRTCEFVGLRPPGETMWVRLCGALFLDLAFYCFQAARNRQRAFIRWTVMTRPVTIILLGVFVAFQLENPIVLLFGIVDLAAAGWTAVSLRQPRAAYRSL